MKSIGFPKMFNSASTSVVEDYDATSSNLNCLLTSEKGELFGDPYFGIRLKRYAFEQNSSVLEDILIDEIYTQLAVFMPQIRVERKDISIVRKQGRATAFIKATNRLNYTTDMYNIVLFDGGEQ